MGPCHDVVNGLEVGLVGGDRSENYCSNPRRGQKGQKSQVRLVGKALCLVMMTLRFREVLTDRTFCDDGHAVYVVHHSSQEPQGATEHLKCGWCDGGTEFSFLIHFHGHRHSWQVATVLKAQCEGLFFLSLLQ